MLTVLHGMKNAADHTTRRYAITTNGGAYSIASLILNIRLTLAFRCPNIKSARSHGMLVLIRSSIFVIIKLCTRLYCGLPIDDFIQTKCTVQMPLLHEYKCLTYKQFMIGIIEPLRRQRERDRPSAA
jgi:hypothetical protein